MKAPARSCEQNLRDGLVRIEGLSAGLHRGQSERIVAEFSWLRMQELVAPADFFGREWRGRSLTYSVPLINCALTRSNSTA